DGLVDWKSRVRINHFVPRLQQRHHAVEHDRLAAGNDADIIRIHFDAARSRDIRGNTLSKFRETGSRSILRPTLIHRLLARLNDVLRRWKIRLTDLEMNDVLALFL